MGISQMLMKLAEGNTMKKTAFLLVLALLLQILLPPSMAGNVYAASTEEVAQTRGSFYDIFLPPPDCPDIYPKYPAYR